jgi:hypothetical protein
MVIGTSTLVGRIAVPLSHQAVCSEHRAGGTPCGGGRRDRDATATQAETSSARHERESITSSWGRPVS